MAQTPNRGKQTRRAMHKLTLGLPLTEGDARLLLTTEKPTKFVVHWRQSFGGAKWALHISAIDLGRALREAFHSDFLEH